MITITLAQIILMVGIIFIGLLILKFGMKVIQFLFYIICSIAALKYLGVI